MAPAVIIDLTSDAEPDESPREAAKSALRPFIPRRHGMKRGGKEGKGSDDESDTSPANAAHTALQNFQPRKEKERPGSKEGGGTQNPFPRANGHQYANTVQSATRPASTEHPRLLPNQGSPNVVQKGSLAALLQHQMTKALRENINAESVKKSNADHTSKSTNGHAQPAINRPAESVNGVPRSQPRLPKACLPAKTLRRATGPLLVNPPLLIVLHDDDPVDSSRDAPQSGKSMLSPGDEYLDLRPFKRRRTEEAGVDASPLKENKTALNQDKQESLERSILKTTFPTTSQIPYRSVSPIKSKPRSTSLQTLSNQPPARDVFNVTPSPASPRKLNNRSANKGGLAVDESPETVPGQALGQVADITHKDSTSLKDHLPNSRAADLNHEVSSRPKQVVTGIPPTGSKERGEATTQHQTAASNFGVPYTAEEDALLIKLKEVDQLGWNNIIPHFRGRTFGSLQVRYSTKLKERSQKAKRPEFKGDVSRLVSAPEECSLSRSLSPDEQAPSRRPRRSRNNVASAVSGYISWAEVKSKRMIEDSQDAAQGESQSTTPLERKGEFETERAYPQSLSSILRLRELGGSGRSWSPSSKSIPDQLKEHVLNDFGLNRYFKGTSGDVMSLAWTPDGRHFAAGSIAITDERSMQYNRPCNLLLGDYKRTRIQELPEHHLPRPEVDTQSSNVNSLHSMRETQDQRLFMTVAGVQFSPDGKILYSAGSDRKARAYSFERGLASCLYEIEHAASVDLLSVSNSGVVATGCHQSTDGSICVYEGQRRTLSLSPGRLDEQTKRAIYPSALRWGLSARHSNLLLAGFSIDSTDDERQIAGETCLWDVRAEARIEIQAVTRNVFDVAWNPSPSSTSTVFAVASTPGTPSISRKMRSVIQCFAPKQNRAARVLEWDCPAFDINDVVYCEHDDNLIAAGATDGRVYIWDQRYAQKRQGPLHILEHGESLNVLDHDRDREVADTGVRFLSWGATSSRLYSGSSDGVVKVWNPYRSSENALITDMATFTSAIMSGAFSPDKRDLLIGEDQGRINLLTIGYENKAVRAMQRFDLHSAPAPAKGEAGRHATLYELLKTGQIELRPMGALPIRQAVQGPRYNGPFLEPSAREVKKAETEYQRSRDEQNVVHFEAAQKVDERVKQAQDAIQRLQERADDAATLKPLAEANQRALRGAARKRLALEASLSAPVENCKFDCNFLPMHTDDDGDVPDSLRSEGRIPGRLRFLRPVNYSNMPAEELVDDGLTSKCTSCFGATSEPNRGQLALCEQCHRSRNGLTASCKSCFAPVRPSTSKEDSCLCEKCNFACFRCARPASVIGNASGIVCWHCRRIWKAGVLGYEMTNHGGALRVKGKWCPQDSNSDIVRLGDRQIEHYASRWQTK